MSILRKDIIYFAFLFMAMTLVACTGDSVRVVVVYGEEQMFVGEEQTLSATVRPISLIRQFIGLLAILQLPLSTKMV